MHEITTLLSRCIPTGRLGWWLGPSVGCCQYARDIYIFKSSMPSRCQLVLPRLFPHTTGLSVPCTRLLHLCYTCAAVGPWHVNRRGVRAGVWGVWQAERKSSQCLQFKCALQMLTDHAMPRLHTTDGFA
jgi:hypothetical protein